MAQALSSYVLVRLNTCTQELKANLSNVVMTLPFINSKQWGPGTDKAKEIWGWSSNAFNEGFIYSRGFM